MNNVCLMGRLTAEPELKATQSGKMHTQFTVAVNRKFKNQDGNYDADFITVQAWGNTAEFICKYFKKGQMIALNGRIQVDTYEKDGQKQWSTKVIAENVEFCGGKKDSGDVKLGEEVVFDDDDLPF